MRSKEWTKDKCFEIALSHNTKISFITNDNCAYHAAYRNNWLNEMCKHMIAKNTEYWTKDKCRELCLKYNNRKKFRIENNYVYKLIKNNNQKIIMNENIRRYIDNKNL